MEERQGQYYGAYQFISMRDVYETEEQSFKLYLEATKNLFREAQWWKDDDDPAGT